MRLLPQTQHGHLADGVNWLTTSRVCFNTLTATGTIDAGVALAHIFNGAGDFIPSPSFVGADDPIDFGDRLKITHWMEASLFAFLSDCLRLSRAGRSSSRAPSRALVARVKSQPGEPPNVLSRSHATRWHVTSQRLCGNPSPHVAGGGRFGTGR